jgi:uncharacterized protein
MDYQETIDKHYNKKTKAWSVLLDHGKMVAEKALTIAGKNKHLDLDLDFILNASMTHDIGIFLTNAPNIGCFGSFPYICHGYLGRIILEKQGFFDYALVCERHIGTGLTVQEIESKKLPLPSRDMLPVTLEEEIVCLADNFFSKSSKKEKKIKEIEQELKKYQWNHKEKFQNMLKKFNV